ncbi:bifunctional aminoglycoside phosphotransferase/ATP-binding protein [Acidimangrovimonas sediminis]|uniref:bifunctional aminoglycoside phosphotransferase/ATP-binding protein n=1 Tax=Acidimangrovimonas sediminis TaxID=2056283 RepID=UPI000C80BAD8|nr:AAA family ATPase [Acidimangrovimonas sediminis]
MTGQEETLAFLATPRAFGGAAGPVTRIDTHGAAIFLHGDTALKLKRAVRYDYMDLSTPERRHEMLARELALNAPAAPGIYRDVLPVLRGPDGLRLGRAEETGDAVDWVLRMHRFPASDELEAVAERGALDDALAAETGRMVQRYHAAAPVRPGRGAALIGAILDELDRVFAEFPQAAGTQEAGAQAAGAWSVEARTALHRVAPLLDARAAAGHVRRGHGDLHLRNIVLISGKPTPFDALEFSEELGTCDVLYDLAFLLMDLGHRGLGRAATQALSAYLAAARGDEDAGLAALPLFLSVRAAIRAMVLLQTDAATGTPGRSSDDIAAYLAQARAALAPAPARLVAVGGLSGTGKSVLARALAPGIGPAPGAVILSSDEARKIAAGAAAATALPGTAYAPGARGAVYAGLMQRAGAILAAGHGVLVDATFLDPARRAELAALAAESGIRAEALWLTAPAEVLHARVAARHGDWSDAGTEVLERQLAQASAPTDWCNVDASGTPETTLAAARAALAGR